MNVSLKKEVAEDLIIFKLRRIQDIINTILERWNETDSNSFIQKARDGVGMVQRGS